MTQEEIGKILKLHKMWVDGEEGGVPANLRGVDLSYVDLKGADLRGVDLRGAALNHTNLGYSTGNMSEVKSLFIDTWPVVYTSEILEIGCQRHPIKEWWGFTDEEITEVAEEALDWWRKYKPLIMQIIELSPATPTGHELGDKL